MTTRSSQSLGKRLLPAFVLTSAAAGLVALLDRPTGGTAHGLGVGLGGDAAALPTSAEPTAGSAAPTVTTPPAVSSTTPAVSPTTRAVINQPATTTSPPASTAQPSAGSTCTGKAIDGPTIDTRWGPVQVEAVVSSTGQICDVDAIQSPSDHRRSVSINRHALPILHTEVMDAQSTNINGVSGATITSVGYARSLQAILDGVGG
ncbi:MAG TPA: FMN-binding protein [Ilumatobacteraceae bacterium]